MVKLLDLLDKVLVAISVLTLVGMMLLIMVSVVGRYVFNAPVPDDVVMTELAMTALVFLPLSAVQAAREHVFVTIFTEWMSNKTKVIMETFGICVGLLVFSVFTVATFQDFYQAFEAGAYMDGDLELPESPARFIIFFGITIFAARLLIDAIQSIIGIADGTAVAARSEEDRALETEV